MTKQPFGPPIAIQSFDPPMNIESFDPEETFAIYKKKTSVTHLKRNRGLFF